MDQDVEGQGTEGWVGELIGRAIAGFHKMCYFEAENFNANRCRASETELRAVA
jgi:hypothetical protein